MKQLALPIDHGERLILCKRCGQEIQWLQGRKWLAVDPTSGQRHFCHRQSPIPRNQIVFYQKDFR